MNNISRQNLNAFVDLSDAHNSTMKADAINEITNWFYDMNSLISLHCNGFESKWMGIRPFGHISILSNIVKNASRYKTGFYDWRHSRILTIWLPAILIRKLSHPILVSHPNSVCDRFPISYWMFALIVYIEYVPGVFSRSFLVFDSFSNFQTKYYSYKKYSATQKHTNENFTFDLVVM